MYNRIHREVSQPFPADYFMWRVASIILVGASLCHPTAVLAEAAGLDELTVDPRSRYEQIELLDHSRYSGLIESEDSNWLTLIRIQSPRGQKMHLVIQPFEKAQILTVSRLDADNRAALQRRIEEFRNRAAIEAVRMEAIRLGPREAEGFRYRHYRTRWFTLDSTADEQNTRRIVVRAEQIFAAYRQIVPPRAEPSQPPRLIVLESTSQYQLLLEKLGLKIKIVNPACFLEDQNAVVVGSELARLSAVSNQITAQNTQLRRELRDLEARLSERLRGVADSLRKSGLSNRDVTNEVVREREKFKKQLERKRAELRQSDQQMDRLFRQNSSQTLVRLYHEAFHAYLRNFVYPRQKHDVPTWLNEGLAEIFEGSLLEVSTLRVDVPNPVALKNLKADLAGPSPMDLKVLLAAGEGQFLLTARSQPATVDRYYAYAWGLAHYLTFERHLLESQPLENYLQPASTRLDPVQRFQQMVGMPIAQFERQWWAYIGGL
jgi:hypothetical protein